MGSYLIVSSDSHVGPVMERDLRPYCPAKYLAEFDAYAAAKRAELASNGPSRFRLHATPVTIAHYDRLATLESLHDPHAFLRDLDEQGIAATLLFAGGGND